MIKKLILMIIFISGLISCEMKDNDVKVTYIVTDSDSGFELYYQNNEKELVYEKVITNSEEDEWKYTFVGERGDIVFMSVIYYDVNSKVRAMIKLDEKIYKEGISRYDTASFLVISGTIPY
ncbi:MAG: hypothetical protein KAT48_03265 [Bacteroidales bacterium]|nr:hypothetical protein [Bacteroidales bacterium]